MHAPDFQLHATLAENSIFIRDLSLCRVLLANDKNYPWIILVPARSEVTEIYQLRHEDQIQLLHESNAVSRTLEELFTPDKLNIAAIGNVVPQLHVHHVARFRRDIAWPAPIWGAHPPAPYRSSDSNKLIQNFSDTLEKYLKAETKPDTHTPAPSQQKSLSQPFVLAQLNIAKMLYPLDTPEMSDFKDNIDRINKLAEQAPGFVWRLQTDDGDATSIDHFGDHVIVNMSTWEDHKSLYDFVFRTEHITYLKRRREWFSHMKVSSVMWWARTNSNPTIEEAAIRLQHLTDNGPSADAFTFKTLAKMPSIS